MKRSTNFRFTLACAAIIAASTTAGAQQADALLKRVSQAMGAEPVQSLKYTAEGTGYAFGQAYVPDMPWPIFTVHSQVRTINYETGSMREEITISRAEPKGGGGYPQSGQQKNEQYVSGVTAWNIAGGNPVAGPRFVVDRTHQLWITPHGVVRAALKNGAKVAFVNRDGKPLAAVSFTQPGAFSAVAYVNADNLIERVESRVPEAVLGEITVVTSYSDYRDFGGLKFPSSIQQWAAGHPVLEVTVKEVAANAPADIGIPEAVRGAGEKVAAEKVADGVWFIGGGSHNSVAIEMKDHMVLVEAPLNDGRTVPVLEELAKLAPGKPLRYVINSHQHHDHAGGLRAAAAEGATIVTQAANRPYLEKAFATPVSLNPDRYAAKKAKAKFLEVKDRHTMTDGTRTIEIERIADSVHSDSFLMVYLPKEKLLIEADAYTPQPPNAQPPATPNANNVNLIENIEKRKLAVEKILPLHGRVVPIADLYATAKMTPR
jgi:glyoxylase-like metal-dependent hydrolase (beta-lactamase superfamily II)